MTLTPELSDSETLEVYRAEVRRLRQGVATVVRRLETSRTLRHCDAVTDLRQLLDGHPQHDF